MQAVHAYPPTADAAVQSNLLPLQVPAVHARYQEVLPQHRPAAQAFTLSLPKARTPQPHVQEEFSRDSEFYRHLADADDDVNHVSKLSE